MLLRRRSADCRSDLAEFSSVYARPQQCERDPRGTADATVFVEDKFDGIRRARSYIGIERAEI